MRSPRCYHLCILNLSVMATYEKHESRTPSQTDSGSIAEKEDSRPHDEFENTSKEFDVYGDETDADSVYH